MNFCLRILKYIKNNNCDNKNLIERFGKLIFKITTEEFNAEKKKYLTLLKNLLTYNYKNLKETKENITISNLYFSSMFLKINTYLVFKIFFKKIMRMTINQV
jgi:hypothetical protein